MREIGKNNANSVIEVVLLTLAIIILLYLLIFGPVGEGLINFFKDSGGEHSSNGDTLIDI